MKKATLIVTGLVTVGLLAGCTPEQVKYENKVYEQEALEEMLGDKMELENPGKDIEVNIIVGVDD